MQIIHGLDSFRPPPGGVTLTIGNFDGVHTGHQSLLETARRVAHKLGAPVVAMTFEPHPLAVLAPERAPQRLLTASEKLHLLRHYGVETCLVLQSEPALLSQPAELFLERIAARCQPRAFVEGPDFNFGRGRQGSVDTLRAFGAARGLEVHVIETWHSAVLPGAPSVHSSAIRAALREGRVDIARAMLGRPYRLVGREAPGAGRGAGLGFPTVNVSDIPHMLPQFAVYAAVAQLADGRLYLSAVNIGEQPTFEGHTARVEAHVLDWNDSLRGAALGLHLLHRLRPQRRFANVTELIQQIEQDVVATRRLAPELDAIAQAPQIPLTD